jgi:predicted Zn-dependent protease
VSPSEEEKQSSIQKIVDTNIAFAQKQIDAGKPEQALEALRPLLRNFPDNAALLNILGITYLALSRAEQAKTYFQKAYKKEKAPGYALNLSSALISLGDYLEAEKVLLEHVTAKTYAYMERIYHNYGLTFEKRKRYKKALAFYNKALDENPSYYLSNLRIGAIYKKFHKKQAAFSAFEKAYQSCQICIDALSELCKIYFQNGQYAKSSQMLREFLSNKDISPQSKKQARNLLILSNKGNRKS